MSDIHLSPTMRRILLEALLICIFAATVGMGLNFSMVMNAFTGKTVAANSSRLSVPDVIAYPDLIELDEIDELLAEGALLIDARNSAEYAKSHLAGAVSMPLGESTERLAGFIAAVPKETVLVAYCNGFGCPDSFDLGVILLKEGFQHVRVFEGGYPEWRDAGRPLQEGTE